MAEIVHTGVNGGKGNLFQGMRFWISAKVPQRNRFRDEVEANGGEVRKSEHEADIKIVDHARRIDIPGSYSYTFIEASMRNGALEELENHRAGPSKSSARTVGSTTQPAKTTRCKFTEEDDQILLKWVHDKHEEGLSTSGNEIYKQLESMNNRHTWQSWRDHYLRTLTKQDQEPAMLNAPPTPPSDHLETNSGLPREPHQQVEEKEGHFSKEDMECLLDLGEHIVNILPENTEAAWEKWADEQDESHCHSASDWRNFWEQTVYLEYQKRAKKAEATAKKFSAVFNSPASKSNKGPIVDMVNADPLPHEEPNGSSKSSSYHPEPPKMAQNYPRENQQIPRSENSTESESASTDLPDLQGIFYPSLEDQTDGCRTPKRKRPGDEEELSDNSPLQEAFYNKKQRRESMRLPKEIPSTPGSSPTQTRISRSMAVRDVTPPFAPHDAEEHQKDDHQEDISEDEENDYGETVEEGEELECLETLLEGNGLMGRQASPVLSEPDPTIRSTQRIFNDETQQIDFDVPPPEQGWGENSSPSQSSNSEHSHEAPNDWTIELLPPESPPAVSSPPLSPSDPLITATIGQLDTWLDDHVAAGHTLEETKHALRCTSMDRDLADLVLEHIRLHAVIPDDMPGVWTTADDEDLESVDSRKIGRVQAKHGTEAVDLRWLYWDAVKNSERSS